MKFIFLIDYDNVPEKAFADCLKLGEDVSVKIFFTQDTQSISLSTLNKLKNKIEYLKVDPGKEALDKQLCSYLGYLIASNNNDTSFVIISNDKGYKCVKSFWNNQNIEKNILIFPNSKECDNYFKQQLSKSTSLKNKVTETKSQTKQTAKISKETEFNNSVQQVICKKIINGEKLEGKTISKAASIVSRHRKDPNDKILDNICKALTKEFGQEIGNNLYSSVKKLIKEYKKEQ